VAWSRLLSWIVAVRISVSAEPAERKFSMPLPSG
jgi:hypothetical protein